MLRGNLFFCVSDSCKKTAVVVDDLISALEFVNCQSVQSQVYKVNWFNFHLNFGLLVGP